MKKLLLSTAGLLFFYGHAFANYDVWTNKSFDFSTQKNICVVYEHLNSYENEAVDLIVQEKLKSYIDKVVNSKLLKYGCTIKTEKEITEKIRDFDTLVNVCLNRYEKGKRYVEGTSYTIPETKTSTYVMPGTYGVGVLTHKENKVVNIPGHTEDEISMVVSYIVKDLSTNEKVFLMTDFVQRDGNSIEKTFEKTLKNFWKLYEKCLSKKIK
ncbi:MAG: hypothetical protein MJ048_00795 [Acidaminococcaceae bacterium]|nr:hypothetical protein [Acidaminococcaceae bacterium]